MKKFLKLALKSQWKVIFIILVLVILQAFFQIQVINLFSAALKDVKSQKIDLLFFNGTLMFAYTILSMITIYAVSFLSTRVSSKAAFNTREKIFNILMNLPDEEINKFKITGLISRSTRGIYSEQGFIMLMLEHIIIIPCVFIGVVIEMAFIDKIFAGLFAAFIIVMGLFLIFKLRQITALYFKAKKTYGKINLLFLSKIDYLANKEIFKKQESHEEFEKACWDSYDKNIKYQLSQYYLGPILLLVLYVFIVLLVTMMSLGYSIGFQAETAIDSVIIIQYILYFITTLAIIPTLIERWPRAYATSVRLEEVLNLEDKIIKTKSKNIDLKRIEIIKEDIGVHDKGILVDRRGIVKNFKKLLNKHRIRLLISIALLTISTLCIVYAPKVAGNIINLIVVNSNHAHDYTIYVNIALLFALYSFGCLLKLPSNRMMVFVGEKIAYNLRIELFDKLECIDSDFIQKNSKGNILSRLNNDLMNIREFIIFHISGIFAQFLSMFFVLVLILTTDWRLSLIYLITFPIYTICFYYSDIKSKKQYEDHHKHLGRMMSYFERSLRNRNPAHGKGFEKINKTVTGHYIKSRNISNVALPITTFLINISNIMVYIVGVYFLVTNEIQLGTLLAVIIYGQLLTKPLKNVSTSIISLETSFASIKRIFDIIEFPTNERS